MFMELGHKILSDVVGTAAAVVPASTAIATGFWQEGGVGGEFIAPNGCPYFFRHCKKLQNELTLNGTCLTNKVM